MSLELTIDATLTGRVRLGVLLLEGVNVRAEDPGLVAEIEEEGRRLRARYGSVKSGDVPGADQARTLYKALGLDPTKTRPSNEALLRRVLKGEALYRVNTLVDALNLCSLRSQLPFGLYDADRISPPAVLRKGIAGEGYEGIRKGRIDVEGRPVLVDAEGPFGNPTSDSARTMITLDTRRALVTVYAPGAYPVPRLREVVADTGTTLTRWAGGEVRETALLPSG